MLAKYTTTSLLLCAIAASAYSGTMGTVADQQGLFIGIGGNYNSLSIQQDSWGLGISSLYKDGVYNSVALLKVTQRLLKISAKV